MASRTSKVVAAAVGGFVVTLGAFLLYHWASGGDETVCLGDCVPEFAAAVTGGIVTGTLVGAACGFLAYVLTQQQNNA